VLFALALVAVSAAAQDERAPEPERAPDAIRYRLVVEGPNPPADALRSGLDLARWEVDEEMTLDLLERLAKEAVPQAREIAAIEGFYDAKVDVAIDRKATPIVVTLKVDPGERTRVAKIDVTVSGPATNDAPLGTAAVAEARDGWSLKLGEAFRQADWLEAKERAVAALRRSPYAAARIAGSEARVDPEQASAELRVAIESGPPFRLGPLEVRGLSRYPRSLVENFNVFERGEPYTQDKLDTYVRRLAATGYFASVHASIDPESPDPSDAAVNVAVIEGPRHRFEGALSYSTDTGYGARASYTNVNVDDRALQMRVDGRLETKWQLAKVAFTWPPSASRYLDTATIGAERTDFENTLTTTAAISYERRGVDERRHPVYTAAAYYDRQEPQGADPIESHALYVEAGYVLRRVDDLLSPTKGYMIDARAGVGIPGVSTRGFGRLIARSAAWYPIDRLTQLAFRAEAGAVLASEREGIPSVLLFRTGGDTTVRGYAYQSLGVQLGDAVVGGRFYALASAELIRWIDETWGIAVFVDAGDASDSVSSFDPAFGYGVGARVATPIGPFRLDVAYGQMTQEWRIHFSVGITF
jgi:translocation and assembly module TamA